MPTDPYRNGIQSPPRLHRTASKSLSHLFSDTWLINKPLIVNIQFVNSLIVIWFILPMREFGNCESKIYFLIYFYPFRKLLSSNRYLSDPIKLRRNTNSIEPFLNFCVGLLTAVSMSYVPPGLYGTILVSLSRPNSVRKEYLTSVISANLFCWPCACDSSAEGLSMPLVGTAGLH